MKKIISLLTTFSFCQLLFPQISHNTPSSVSIAQTPVADTRNWTSLNNPAMLGYVEQTEISFQFENRYLISELSTKNIQLAFSTVPVNVGISFSHFGYSHYHEMIAGLNLSRNFSDKFSLGMQFNYCSVYFASSNTYRGALLPAVGFSARLTPALSIGFSTYNPFQFNINGEYTVKRIPSVFSFGTEYFFSPELVWRTQADKEVSSNYRFATGFEYLMVEKLTVKLGVYGSDYLIPCMGFGFNLGLLQFDLNCEAHPLLGLNSLAAVKYRFQK
jgi:hypothetical protein